MMNLFIKPRASFFFFFFFKYILDRYWKIIDHFSFIPQPSFLEVNRVTRLFARASPYMASPNNSTWIATR